MDMQDIMRQVEERYPFNADKYDELYDADDEKVRSFALRHMALHIAKSYGKFASYCEAEDHGATGDAALLEEATIKLLVNVIRAAQLQGMDADRMFGLMPQYMKKREVTVNA
jgi:hypothetical protein